MLLVSGSAGRLQSVRGEAVSAGVRLMRLGWPPTPSDPLSLGVGGVRGEDANRTRDIMLAKHALCQLSYIPRLPCGVPARILDSVDSCRPDATRALTETPRGAYVLQNALPPTAERIGAEDGS